MKINTRGLIIQVERASAVFLAFSAIGALCAGVVCGAVYGVAWDRKRPQIYSLEIIGDAHAGDDLRIRERATIPENCLPRVMRKLVTGPDALSDGHDVTQILTDSTVVANGDILIPLPPGVPVGPWRYFESISTQNCGVFSGVLPPLIANAHDTAGKLGVEVTILPRKPVPTRFVK